MPNRHAKRRTSGVTPSATTKAMIGGISGEVISAVNGSMVVDELERFASLRASSQKHFTDGSRRRLGEQACVLRKSSA
jgi:hypothetical protein